MENSIAAGNNILELTKLYNQTILDINDLKNRVPMMERLQIIKHFH